MTFTEAAIEVLRREGKPLHFKKIAEIAAREDLLDHVGKIPEETMAGQLVAHSRLPKADRRVIAVQHGTFALVEWGLDEDPTGIDDLVEPPPADEVAYRSNERHPIPSREVARSTGRGEGRARRREEGEERRGKRFPPPAEVAYEILAGAGKPLGLVEIAAHGSERSLMPEAFVSDTGSLRAALLEDNRRRESSGRKPLFELDGEGVTLAAQPEPGERAAAPLAGRGAVAATDVRRGALAALRRRLADCDGPTFEFLAAAILERLGYQEIKVAKRGREHAIYTARKRLGVADLKHGIRVLRAHGEVTRRDVQDLRRDLSSYGAQIGLVIGTGDAQRDARSEAVAGGQLPVILLCGEALVEAAAETGLGCKPVVIPEIDEGFFRMAAAKGAEEETARRARREERERREGRDGRREERKREPGEGRAAAFIEMGPSEGTAEAEPPPPAEPSGEGLPPFIEVRATIAEEATGEPDEGEGDDDEGGDEAVDEGPLAVSASGASSSPAGEAGAEGGEARRRRRRRRRRRGGRGRREGATTEGATAEGQGAAPAGAEARPEGSQPPPSDPTSGGGAPET